MEAENNLSFAGSHGTFKSNAEGIIKKGFIASSNSYSIRGTGIYFWKKNIYWKELAIAWTRKKDDERKSIEKYGVVFYCSIKTDENNFLDLDEEEVQEKIAILAEEIGVLESDRKAKCKLFDLLITTIENEFQHEIKLYLARVNPPPEVYFRGMKIYHSSIFGEPHVIIVRDAKCILKESYEKCEEFEL